MAKPMSRQQIAQRIHVVMLREIGHAIEIERLLADPRYARDVLLVCDALPRSELAPLALQFRQIPLPVAAQPVVASAPGHAHQPTEWSRDTSGFGVTQPPQVGPPAVPGRRASDAEPAPAADRRRGWLPRWRE